MFVFGIQYLTGAIPVQDQGWKDAARMMENGFDIIRFGWAGVFWNKKMAGLHEEMKYISTCVFCDIAATINSSCKMRIKKQWRKYAPDDICRND